MILGNYSTSWIATIL